MSKCDAFYIVHGHALFKTCLYRPAQCSRSLLDLFHRASNLLNQSSPSWASSRRTCCDLTCGQPRRTVVMLVCVFTLGIKQISRRDRTYQIICTTDQTVPHTGTILQTTAAHQNHTVLLDVVALAGDVRRDVTARRQPHTRRLALTRVRLLWPRNADLEAHTLQKGRVGFGQGGRHRPALPALLTATTKHLVECGLGSRRRREGAEGGGGQA